MKVLLLKDVLGLGQKNDIKEVKEGYARNFLFAKKIAILATDAVMRSIAREKTDKEQQHLADKKKYQDIANDLQSVEVVINTKIGEKGKAFGSVGAGHIKKALEEQGIMIEEEWIDLKEPIKTTGTIQVPIAFPHGISGFVNVIIKPE